MQVVSDREETGTMGARGSNVMQSDAESWSVSPDSPAIGLHLGPI
jgi:hypothetical protein